MDSSARLDSAIFQLTPTRTRCDLVISANGKMEKIASGLLNPFLAHLKTAQDQIAKGGYSILLEPEPGSDATWFTKGMMERFVRFVSTPDILERVYIIESEISQIDKAIALQGKNDVGLGSVEACKAGPMGNRKGNRATADANEEKAVILYELDVHLPDANGSTVQQGDSKDQLLKVLETRKAQLQREQGMAFARAVAAGFYINYMAPLVSFAECFGASRLMTACLRFIDLWKRKHENGQWVEIGVAEAMSSQSEFSVTKESGLILSSKTNRQSELHGNLVSDNNGKGGIDVSAEKKPFMDNEVPLAQQEYFQGHLPHPMFCHWYMNSPSGTLPVLQSYPVQGMPYYQNHPANGPFYQSPYPPELLSRINISHRAGQKRPSMDGKDSNGDSEAQDMDATKRRSQSDLTMDKEVSQSQGRRKRSGRSDTKQSGMVVIRNINYITSEVQNSSGRESQSASDSETRNQAGNLLENITSKIQNSSGTESQSASDSENDNIDGDLQVSAPEIKKKKYLSLKSKVNPPKSVDESNSKDSGETNNGVETDDGHWQAFQKFLLRDTHDHNQSADEDMFGLEKVVQLMQRQKTVVEDPFIIGQDSAHAQGRISDFHEVNGKVALMLRTSNNEALISRGKRYYSNGRCSTYYQTDSQATDMNLVHATNNLDRSSLQCLDDEFRIVPFRPTLEDQVGINGRTGIDLESELRARVKKSEKSSFKARNNNNYEANDLSLMPERGPDKQTIGFDAAQDFSNGKKVKNTADAVDKKKTVGPMMKVRPSKMSPSDDARARAEGIRALKADLQKMKKEKQEEERKRLETLKLERQRRIASRGSSPAARPTPSLQTRKQFPIKLPLSSCRGSKFSDSEPGTSSPLQRSKIRTDSLGSGESHKAYKITTSSSRSYFPGNRLIRSASSLSESRKESRVTPDSKAKASMAKTSMVRMRRLSEPKTIGRHNVVQQIAQSAKLVSKPKVSKEPENKIISTALKLDRHKAATLPEPKIEKSRRPLVVGHIKSVPKEKTQKPSGEKSFITSGSAKLNKNKGNHAYQQDVDDNPVIEKTVVMLEHEKPSIPVLHASTESLAVQKEHHGNCGKEEKNMVSEDAAIGAPALLIDRIEIEPVQSQLGEQLNSFEVTRYPEKESPRASNEHRAEKSCKAPYACISSLEDPCTKNLAYSKAPSSSSDTVAAARGTAKVQLSSFKNLRLEGIPESVEKPEVKDSPKGLRRFLKFGKKKQSLSEQNNAGSIDLDEDDNATKAASSSEVHTLKYLISRADTSSSGTTQKSLRNFSLLSSFRSKSSEKKPTTQK
ncbi:hypothetical protein NMG60_11031948 [Bertholletia excelsa]